VKREREREGESEEKGRRERGERKKVLTKYCFVERIDTVGFGIIDLNYKK
jgi:hypothetical protein